MKLSEFNSKLQAIDMEELIRQAVISNESKLLDMNRRQMLSGERSDGDLISPDYFSLSYAFEKKKMGTKAPFGVPDLKYTGAFQRDMVLLVEGNEWEIGSTDDKTPELTRKYAKIFGLTKENTEQAKVINTATLGELFKKAAGL